VQASNTIIILLNCWPVASFPSFMVTVSALTVVPFLLCKLQAGWAIPLLQKCQSSSDIPILQNCQAVVALRVAGQ
jgi:hypothetical protein